MEKLDNFKTRFKRQLELTNDQIRVLESIRFQDEDRSTKLGSLLAFSGLIIATSIVQLSTSEDSIVHVDNENLVLLVINIIGLVLIFFASFICLFALISSKKYSSDTEEAIIQFDDLVKAKSNRVKWATRFLIFGTILILISLLLVLFQSL